MRMSVAGRRVIHMPTITEPTVAELLNFEARWPRHSGYKEAAIIDDFAVAPARYYVLLRRAASCLEGQAHDPFTAHRVLRQSSRVRQKDI